MFLLDANGTYLDYYPKNPTGLYVPPEQFLGKNIRDVLPSDIGPAVVKKFEEASLTGDAATIEFWLTIQNVPRFREARIVQVQDGKYLAIVRDISADKQAAAELKRSNRFIQRIAETLPNFLFIYDRLERRHVYMNGGITAILGYSVCEIRGMGRDVLGNLVHPHDRPGLEAQFSKLENLGDNQVLHSIYRMRHKNGKWRWIQGSQAVFARSDDGQVRQIIGTATDITENQRTQEELQLLSSRLLSYHDEERKKVAEELHEVTAQNLFAVTLNLRSLRQLEASTHLHEDFRFRFDALVTECEKLCERSLREVRTSSYSLRPPAQDQLGLSSTLRWYVDGFEKRSGIRVDLTVDEGIDGLPLELETDLFRVVQEGLGNVAQHSGSDVAIVQLEKYPAEIVLRIEDHGRGLPDLTNEREAEDSVGLGIPEMKQRLRQLGGRLEISSTSNGTILVARVPISSSHQVKLLTR